MANNEHKIHKYDIASNTWGEVATLDAADTARAFYGNRFGSELILMRKYDGKR